MEELAMQGKTCMVTGANSGIGKATAFGLAKMGATVVMVCRSPERGEAARADIMENTGNKNIDLQIADLSSQRSIRQLAANFEKKHSRLDVLVNNAGGIFGPRTLTEDGLEYTFAVNHLAYFLLTNLLLYTLKSSAPARVVNVSSEAHRGAEIIFDDLQGAKRYSEQRAYSQSKLANLLFTYELARRLNGTQITVNALHPGVVRTNFGNSASTPFRVVVKIVRPLMRSPEKGAETVIYLASTASLGGVSGKYFFDKKEKRSSEMSYDESAAKRLWEVSEQLAELH